VTAGLIKRIERTNYLLTALAGVLGGLFLPGDRALGLLIGALIGSINFSMIAGITARWLAGAAKGGGGSGYFLIPKMGGLIAVIALAIFFLPLDPLFLGIGFSVFLVSITFESMRQTTDEAHG
jgi:hypothetical protein